MKRILQKSLFRLRALLLLAVMFVVGGSAWAETVTFNGFASNTTTKDPITVSGLAESNHIFLYSGSPSFTISATSGYTITQVDIEGENISSYLNTLDGNKGTVGARRGTWTFDDKESITFSGSYSMPWDQTSVSTITVTYHASAPAAPVTYTINVNNPEGAEGAGVTYDGQAYTHNQTFSTTAQVKESDFQVVPVAGYAASGSLVGTTYTATYTKQYAYTIAIEGLSAADAHKGAIVADGQELTTGTHYFDAPLSDFSVKKVKYYDAGEIVSNGSGKEITLSATYTPFVNVNLVVEGLTASQREEFYFQINGNTFKVNDQVKVSPNKSVQTWIYDAAALSFKGMSYKVVYNEDENTIVVTYTQLDPGANYDFANTVPAANSWQDDAINTVYFYIPNGHEVDMKDYQGSILLQVQRGDEDMQNVQASYQVYGMDHYVQIEFPSSYKAYCGPIAITVPEGSFSTKFWDGGVQKTSANNAMTLSYNTKYHYMVYYDQEGKTNLTGAKILVDGVEYPVNNAVFTTTPMSKDAITVVNPSGYEGVISNIDPATNSNYGYGAIYVKYERVYTYDDLEGTTTTKKTGEIKLDYVTLNFPKDVYELNGQITMDGIPVSRTQFSYPGHTELTIYFAETVYGEGEHTLVIPQGFFCIPNGTYNYRDVDDYDRNSRMEIIYTLAPSYVYDVTIVDENESQAGLPSGAGFNYKSDNTRYTNGSNIIVGAPVVESDVNLLATDGYTTDVTITDPTADANGEIKVVYTLNRLNYVIVVNGLDDASDVNVTVANSLSNDGMNVVAKGTVSAENVTATKVPFYDYVVSVTDPEGENSGIITVTYSELVGPFTTTFDVSTPQVFTVGETYKSVDGNIGLTYAASAGWGDSMGYYNNDQGQHFYALGTFKFTAPEGYVITDVNMQSNGSWCYQDWYVTCDTKGTFDYGTNGSYYNSYATWSGSKNEVEFSSQGDAVRYRTITITYDKYVAPTTFAFAASDITPSPTNPIVKFGTVTINAPEGVTFTGKGDNNKIMIGDEEVYLYDWNFHVYETSLTFEVNNSYENGEYTLTIPENFVTAAGNRINAEFSVEYTVFDPYFNLALEEGSSTTVAKLESIRLVAPEGVTFDEPNTNITISIDLEDTPATASLDGDVLVIAFPAITKQGYCRIRIDEDLFTANEGLMKNKSTSTNFTIKPNLSVNQYAQDGAGNYWTTFCYNDNATISGATPYIVVSGEDGLELQALEGAYPSATALYYVDYKGYTYVADNKLYCPDYAYDGLNITLNNVEYSDGNYLTFNAGSSMTIECDVNIQKVELSGVYGSWYSWSVNGDDSYTHNSFNVNSNSVTLASDYAYITQICVYYDDETKDRKAPVIPAGEGVLVKATAPGSLSYTNAAWGAIPANVDGNLLRGCTETTVWNDSEKWFYKLTWKAGEGYEDLGFYWDVDGGHSMRANAGKAYLVLDAEQANSNRMMIFGGNEGTPTAIDAVESVVADAPIFNLQGKRVSSENLPAGVYVKNGRKFIVK